MALAHSSHFVHGGVESTGDTGILKHAPREESGPHQEQVPAGKAPPPSLQTRSGRPRPRAGGGKEGNEDAFVALAHAVEAESPGSAGAKDDPNDWDDFVLGEGQLGEAWLAVVAPRAAAVKNPDSH